MTARDELLAAALATAKRGWPVFPLQPGTKRPALHGAAHCPGTGPCAGGHVGWERRATTNPERIRRAWATWPFNIGIPCGPAGLVVVDLDVPKGPDDAPPPRWSQAGARDGLDVFAVVCVDAGHPIPADTHTVTTARGGTHLYFRAPVKGPPLRNTEGETGRGLGWKVDTRAHGGYVVGPGSLTPDGTYWITYDREPVELPGWLAERLRPAPLPAAPLGPVRTGNGRAGRYLEAVLRAETARVHDAPAGQRNACLYVAAVALGQLVAGGSLAEQDARATLLSAAGRHLAAGAYSPRQAEQTIGSGLRAGAKRPRRIKDAA
jgi:hypothetical protein